jgi:hypothetical protein
VTESLQFPSAVDRLLIPWSRQTARIRGQKEALMRENRSDCISEDVFERLRLSRRPALLYHYSPDMADAWLRELTEPLLRSSGLPFIEVHTARCCVREWGHHYRTWVGSDLAEHLAMSLAKYRDMQVSQELLERLLAVIDEAVGPKLEAVHAVG